MMVSFGEGYIFMEMVCLEMGHECRNFISLKMSESPSKVFCNCGIQYNHGMNRRMVYLDYMCISIWYIYGIFMVYFKTMVYFLGMYGIIMVNIGIFYT